MIKIRKCNSWEMAILCYFTVLYLYPVEIFNPYVPFFLVGAAFLLLVLINSWKIKVKSGFVIYTAWIFLIGLLVSTYVLGIGVFRSFRLSLIVLMPIMSFYIGEMIEKKTNGDCRVISFTCILLMISELIIAIVESLNNSVGFELLKLYASEKYTVEYYDSSILFRSLGTVGNPNTFSIFMLIVGTVLLNISVVRWQKVFAVLVMLVSVLSSSSRTSVVVFVVVILFFLSFFQKSDGFNRKKLSVILFMILSLLFLLKNNKREISMSSLMPRVEIWENVFDSIKALPIKERAIGIIFGFGEPFLKSIGTVDNGYISLFIVSGIVGTMLYISFVCSLIKRSKRIKDRSVKATLFSIFIIWMLSDVTMEFFQSYYLTSIAFFFIGYFLYREKLLIEE